MDAAVSAGGLGCSSRQAAVSSSECGARVQQQAAAAALQEDAAVSAGLGCSNSSTVQHSACLLKAHPQVQQRVTLL